MPFTHYKPQIAHKRYAAFDGERKEAKRLEVEAAGDLRELERITKASKTGRVKGGEDA